MNPVESTAVEYVRRCLSIADEAEYPTPSELLAFVRCGGVDATLTGAPEEIIECASAF